MQIEICLDLSEVVEDECVTVKQAFEEWSRKYNSEVKPGPSCPTMENLKDKQFGYKLEWRREEALTPLLELRETLYPLGASFNVRFVHSQDENLNA